MQREDGGPAFPCSYADAMRGMSLRDWFAGQVLANIIGIDPSLPGDTDAARAGWPKPEELARRRAVSAYLHADAMLAERGKTK